MQLTDKDDTEDDGSKNAASIYYIAPGMQDGRSFDVNGTLTDIIVASSGRMRKSRGVIKISQARQQTPGNPLVLLRSGHELAVPVSPFSFTWSVGRPRAGRRRPRHPHHV